MYPEMLASRISVEHWLESTELAGTNAIEEIPDTPRNEEPDQSAVVDENDSLYDRIEQIVRDWVPYDVATDERYNAVGPEFIEELLPSSATLDQHCHLETLPDEIKLMILEAISDLKTLITFTKASLIYYRLTWNDNLFTKLAIWQLEEMRNVSILPRRIIIPRTFTVVWIHLGCVNGKGELIQEALGSYFRQYSEHQRNIRLSIPHCMAIQNIEEILHWYFWYKKSRFSAV